MLPPIVWRSVWRTAGRFTSDHIKPLVLRTRCPVLIARRFVKPKCGAKRCANSRFFGQDVGGFEGDFKAAFKAKLRQLVPHNGSVLFLHDFLFLLSILGAFFGQDSRLFEARMWGQSLVQLLSF